MPDLREMCFSNYGGGGFSLSWRLSSGESALGAYHTSFLVSVVLPFASPLSVGSSGHGQD